MAGLGALLGGYGSDEDEEMEQQGNLVVYVAALATGTHVKPQHSKRTSWTCEYLQQAGTCIPALRMQL